MRKLGFEQRESNQNEEVCFGRIELRIGGKDERNI